MKYPNGLSISEICREVNGIGKDNLLYCGRRNCGYPNPRKRKNFFLHPCSCKYKYYQVCSLVHRLKNVEIKKEMRYDRIKHGLDPRTIVRLI